MAVLLSGLSGSGRDGAGILLLLAAGVSVLTIVSWQMVSIRAARLGQRTPRRALIGATLAGLVLVALLVVVAMVFWAAAHMN